MAGALLDSFLNFCLLIAFTSENGRSVVGSISECLSFNYSYLRKQQERCGIDFWISFLKLLLPGKTARAFSDWFLTFSLVCSFTSENGSSIFQSISAFQERTLDRGNFIALQLRCRSPLPLPLTRWWSGEPVGGLRRHHLLMKFTHCNLVSPLEFR